MHYLTLLMTHVEPKGNYQEKIHEMLKPFDENNLEDSVFVDYKAELLEDFYKGKLLAYSGEPANKEYFTLEDFLKGEDYMYDEELERYGYRYNPNALYDYYVLGGRFSNSLVTKTGQNVDFCRASEIDTSQLVAYYAVVEDEDTYRKVSPRDKEGEEALDDFVKMIKGNPDMYLYVIDMHI